MRKLAIVLSVVALSLGMAAGLAPAYGQSTTPTSFQGGPDVSSDVTAPPVGQPDVPGGTGIAETEDDDSSPVGWIVAAAVLIVAVAAIAALAAKRNRERGDRPDYRDVPSSI